MGNLERAIKKTLAYSAYFNFPLSPKEVHHWLISPQIVTFEEVKTVFNAQLSPSLFKKRQNYSDISKNKIIRAQKIISRLSFIPTIKLIAVTGSVAVNNARPNDDIDLLIVTKNHSLWLTRPIVILLLSFFSRRRLPGQTHHQAANSFCPNLWLETGSLSIPKTRRNLYTAHEALQIKPLFDRDSTYLKFVKENHWTKRYLANAYCQCIESAENRKSTDKSTLFDLLSSLVIIPLNIVAYILQYLYMRPKMTTEIVSLSSAYFHTQTLNKNIKKHLSVVLR